MKAEVKEVTIPRMLVATAATAISGASTTINDSVSNISFAWIPDDIAKFSALVCACATIVMVLKVILEIVEKWRSITRNLKKLKSNKD